MQSVRKTACKRVSPFDYQRSTRLTSFSTTSTHLAPPTSTESIDWEGGINAP